MYVILDAVRGAHRAPPHRTDDRRRAAPALPGGARRPGGRLRRPARRGPGLDGRLQTADPGPRRRRPRGAARRRSTNVVEKGNAQPGLVGLFSQLPRQAAAALRRRRPREGEVARRHARRRLQHAAGLSRLRLRQRLHPLRPQLAGERPGRLPAPASGPRTSASSRCATPSGDMVPLATLVHVRDTTGPALVNRYNMFPSAEITGNPAPGTSSGQAIGTHGGDRQPGSALRAWASSGPS